MILVGLTGNMGSGKSTAAEILSRHHVKIIDADQLARQVVKPGETAHREIVAFFGEHILQADQSLNRPKLANVVFNDPQKLAELNRITHKEIAKRRDQLISEIVAQSPSQLIVNDIPLLFENNLEAQFQKTILITIAPQIQIDRLVRLRGFSKDEVQERLKNQMDQTIKMQRADYIIDNSRDTEHLEQQILQILPQLKALPQYDWSKCNGKIEQPSG